MWGVPFEFLLVGNQVLRKRGNRERLIGVLIGIAGHAFTMLNETYRQITVFDSSYF